MIYTINQESYGNTDIFRHKIFIVPIQEKHVIFWYFFITSSFYVEVVINNISQFWSCVLKMRHIYKQ